MSIALKKGPKVKVVSQIMEWQGQTVLDIRTYVIASKGDNAGKWIPTAKGVQIPVDKSLRFLRLASSDAKEAIEEAAIELAASTKSKSKSKPKRSVSK